jgi:hypothetical protein
VSEYSGIVLAGGDGTRLSALTRRIAGDVRAIRGQIGRELVSA